MATTSRLERSPEHGTPGRAAPCAGTSSAVARPSAAPRPPDHPRAPRVVARRREVGRLPRAAVRGAPGNASLASLRWAFAFYGGFLFIAVAMAAAIWFVP